MASAAAKVVRRFVERFQSELDMEAFEECLSPDIVDHTPLPGVPAGREGVRALFIGLHQSLPDMRVDIHQMLASGDRVATSKSFVGTHQGDLFGVPATGRSVHIDVIDLVRVADGQIVEHWNVVDVDGLMAQLA